MLDWAKGGRIAAGGAALEWQGFGAPPGTAPVIVLLHEGLGCVALWRDFPARLAEATGLPVFAYSRAGYGHSGPAALPRPLDYMTREAVEVLPALLEALSAAQVVLLGHSDGATIAAEYAGRVADARVRGLVLMAPHFFTEAVGLAEIARAGEAFAATDLREKMARYHDDPVATFRGWNDAWLAPGFRDWNVAGVIDDWRIPALVIQGRQDQYGTLAQVEEIAARSPAPVQTLILDACRHSPHLEQPDAVLTAVAAFIAGLAKGGAGRAAPP